MFQQIFKAGSSINKPSTPLHIIVSGKRSVIMTFFHHAMMVLGIAAIAALGLMFIRPDLNHHFQAFSPFLKAKPIVIAPTPDTLAASVVPNNTEKAAEKAVGIAVETAKNEKMATQPANSLDVQLTQHSKQQQSVTNWLSKRYRVANDAAKVLVSASYHTAKEINLDPLLILSVMAIESGLNPFAESPVGAQGLMQVMSKVHRDKFDDFGGLKAALNPVANIKVGAQILKEYVIRTGSVEGGLKMYVGAASTDNDGGYGGKVMAEYKRLKDVSNGKSVPIFTTTASAPANITKPSVIQVSAPAGDTAKDRVGENDTAEANQAEQGHIAAI